MKKMPSMQRYKGLTAAQMKEHMKEERKVLKKKGGKPVSETAIKHLKEDVKGYSKQRKHLKKEMKEDKDLIRVLKGEKNGGKKKKVVKKKGCCKGCKKGKNCEGSQGKTGKKRANIKSERAAATSASTKR